MNEHNGWVPRDFWLEEWEKQAIVGCHLKNPLEGYRRQTFMMLDDDIVAVSPSSVWRVLSQAGLLSKWNCKPSKKGTGFVQPLAAHQHWHIDVSNLNIGGTFGKTMQPPHHLRNADAARIALFDSGIHRQRQGDVRLRLRQWTGRARKRLRPLSCECFNGMSEWPMPERAAPKQAAAMRAWNRRGNAGFGGVQDRKALE